MRRSASLQVTVPEGPRGTVRVRACCGTFLLYGPRLYSYLRITLQEFCSGDADADWHSPRIVPVPCHARILPIFMFPRCGRQDRPGGCGRRISCRGRRQAEAQRVGELVGQFTFDSERDRPGLRAGELRPRLPGRPRLRVSNAVAGVAGLLWIAALPSITCLTGVAYTDRYGSVQLRPNQLDLRGSVHQRRGARSNLHHPAQPRHTATAGAHPNPSAPSRLPSHRPRRTGTNPRTTQQPCNRPLPACLKNSRTAASGHRLVACRARTRRRCRTAGFAPLRATFRRLPAYL
jgi:hypothetical protein